MKMLLHQYFLIYLCLVQCVVIFGRGHRSHVKNLSPTKEVDDLSNDIGSLTNIESHRENHSTINTVNPMKSETSFDYSQIHYLKSGRELSPSDRSKNTPSNRSLDTKNKFLDNAKRHRRKRKRHKRNRRGEKNQTKPNNRVSRRSSKTNSIQKAKEKRLTSSKNRINRTKPTKNPVINQPPQKKRRKYKDHFKPFRKPPPISRYGTDIREIKPTAQFRIPKMHISTETLARLPYTRDIQVTIKIVQHDPYELETIPVTSSGAPSKNTHSISKNDPSIPSISRRRFQHERKLKRRPWTRQRKRDYNNDYFYYDLQDYFPNDFNASFIYPYDPNQFPTSAKFGPGNIATQEPSISLKNILNIFGNPTVETPPTGTKSSSISLHSAIVFPPMVFTQKTPKRFNTFFNRLPFSDTVPEFSVSSPFVFDGIPTDDDVGIVTYDYNEFLNKEFSGTTTTPLINPQHNDVIDYDEIPPDIDPLGENLVENSTIEFKDSNFPQIKSPKKLVEELIRALENIDVQVQNNDTAEDEYEDECSKWKYSPIESVLKSFAKISHLPACPCVYPSHIVYNDAILDSLHNTTYKWQNINMKATTSSFTGSHFCIRTVILPRPISLSAQKCCYDKYRNLITRGRGAASPMYVTPEISRALHEAFDVVPWKACKGNFVRYHSFRNPDNSMNCTDNPDDLKYQEQIYFATHF